jgi:hypothetical protein
VQPEVLLELPDTSLDLSLVAMLGLQDGRIGVVIVADAHPVVVAAALQLELLAGVALDPFHDERLKILDEAMR